MADMVDNFLNRAAECRSRAMGQYERWQEVAALGWPEWLRDHYLRLAIQWNENALVYVDLAHKEAYYRRMVR